MAATSRHEYEMKMKCKKAATKTTDPVELLRLKCLERGASGIKGLGRQVGAHANAIIAILLTSVAIYRTFRIMDDDGNKKLDYREFEKGIYDYGLDLEPEVRP